MVQSGNNLYAIGGFSDDFGFQSAIYKFSCDGDIDSCAWEELPDISLKYALEAFVAMAIPDALADSVCPQSG